MTELPVPHAPQNVSEVGGSDARSQISARWDVDPASFELVGSACRSLVAFGTWTRWGLVALGVMAGVGHVLDSAASVTTNPAKFGSNILSALSVVLASCLAGWGITVVSRVTASTILECLGHAARAAEFRSRGLSDAIDQLERLVESLREPIAGRALSTPATTDLRARLIAEIATATQAARWADAQARLDELASSLPNDPELTVLREHLARARTSATELTLSQLSAAREVNDPDRALELYDVAMQSLGQSERAALEQDVAKWFLSLIHRRLRSGKVQPDVVQLASRFAEKFASTVEGASVRASLSTLRRSIGLCPRCSQPYTGIADACPKCKKAAAKPSPTFLTETEVSQPE